MKTAAMSELSDAGAESDKVAAGYVGSSLNKGVTDVIYLVLMKAEAVAAGIWPGPFVRGVLDNVLEVVTGEFVELLKHGGGLFLVQGPHRRRSEQEGNR